MGALCRFARAPTHTCERTNENASTTMYHVPIYGQS
jgi:hypothetical protein